jgi:hypothetical protein
MKTSHLTTTSSAVGGLVSLVSIDSHCRGQSFAAPGGFASLFCGRIVAMECDGSRLAIVASAPTFALAAVGSFIQRRHPTYIFCLE